VKVESDLLTTDKLKKALIYDYGNDSRWHYEGPDWGVSVKTSPNNYEWMTKYDLEFEVDPISDEAWIKMDLHDFLGGASNNVVPKEETMKVGKQLNVNVEDEFYACKITEVNNDDGTYNIQWIDEAPDKPPEYDLETGIDGRLWEGIIDGTGIGFKRGDFRVIGRSGSWHDIQVAVKEEELMATINKELGYVPKEETMHIGKLLNVKVGEELYACQITKDNNNGTYNIKWIDNVSEPGPETNLKLEDFWVNIDAEITISFEDSDGVYYMEIKFPSEGLEDYTTFELGTNEQHAGLETIFDVDHSQIYASYNGVNVTERVLALMGRLNSEDKTNAEELYKELESIYPDGDFEIMLLTQYDVDTKALHMRRELLKYEEDNLNYKLPVNQWDEVRATAKLNMEDAISKRNQADNDAGNSLPEVEDYEQLIPCDQLPSHDESLCKGGNESPEDDGENSENAQSEEDDEHEDGEHEHEGNSESELPENDENATPEGSENDEYGVSADENITDEWTVDVEWFGLEMSLPFLVIFGVGLLILGIMLYFCFRRTEDAPIRTEDAPMIPVPDIDPNDPEFVGVTYRRRLCETPIISLAREIGIEDVCDVSQQKSLPGQKLSAEVPPGLSPIIQDKDLIWVIPLSCLIQVFWIYAVRKAYKICCRNRSDKSRTQRAS